VVIQITPQTELANPLIGEARPPGESPGVQNIREWEGESPQKAKSAKSKLGVFAQILSGMRKTGAGEKAAGDIKPEESAKTSKSDDLRSVQKSKNKIGKMPAKAEKTGETESELLLQTGLSVQEKNLLFTAGYLAGEFKDDKNELADETADFVVSLGKWHSAEGTEEAIPVDKAGLEAMPKEQPEKAAAANGKLGEGLEISKASSEKTVDKAKNRSETAAKSGNVTAETPAQMGVQQAEAKRTVLGEKHRLDEARNRDKKRGVTVDVRDLRNASTETIQKDSVVQVKASAETRPEQGSAKDITLELRLSNQGQENQTAVTSWETKAAQAFEDILARELHQNLNNDIVRHASVILRDSSEGTIRLALKPESLGNVKIRLEMAENKITGFITVESEEALRAFEREVTFLEKAFVESGFEGANLEMSLAADGGGSGQWREAEGDASLAMRIGASNYEATAAEWAEMPADLDYYYQGTMSINVLA
jgi:flagellar hook-length control protein FliK